MNAACLLLSVILLPADASAPREELLWPKGAPGAVGSDSADKPSLTTYLPPTDKANGCAVLVCPGGGYGGLAMDHEGKQIATWLNEHGVTAFVLKYRLGPRYHHPAPLQDAQRAMRMIRARAVEGGLDPKRVGVWGFSAGGHLASTLSTHFDEGDTSSTDTIDRQSCRPDFAILAYPVITLQPPHTHGGSRKNLLGDKPDEKLVESLCNDKQVTKQTPPTFLFHTTTDTAVPVENAILYFSALRKSGVPAELHIYEKGPHGVGLAARDPVLSSWPGRLADWLKARGYLTSTVKK
jgi:acetyl esterase/lipase